MTAGATPAVLLVDPDPRERARLARELEGCGWCVWAVPDAASYVLQYSTDPSFSVASRGEFNNIPDTTFSFAIADPEGNYFARVFAVDVNGNFSAPSNVISFSVFYNNGHR